MINFKKKLATSSLSKKLDPIEIYDSLDRASDKGPLRPSQEAVLRTWSEDYRNKKDVILKLHTGQGKTLVGLLMLQSKLHEAKGPALYLCPNKYLVEQTCEQAKQFGVKFCRVGRNNQIPQGFWESTEILITHVQMLFNGQTKFGLRTNSIDVGSIVLDDSHACIDTIQEAFTITIPRVDKAYIELLNLFEVDLESQGQARIEEIKVGEYDSFLPVPYWAWQDKLKEVVSILVKHKESSSIYFTWELIKDTIRDCQCIISGSAIEIIPYHNSIELFGSFQNAGHRILMSATTNNDSFFIKGLGIDVETVKNPIIYKNEKWSGEKMVVIPYLMNEELNRVTIVNRFAAPNEKRKYGVVALTPSLKAASYWEQCGAIKSDTNSIESVIKLLKEGKYEKTIVIANRYDGIDLPDEMCRILILDSKPYAQSLNDRYQENCRADSKIIDVKIAQKIEQGFGRAVRGEKDYCIIVVTGDDLIGTVRMKKLSKYFSAQTNKQIEIGLEATQFAVAEATTDNGLELLVELMKLSLNRDEGWKTFYSERMNEIELKDPDNDLLKILELEKDAELKYAKNDFAGAVKKIQTVINDHIPKTNRNEKGWYLQEMARYSYPKSRVESNELQLGAYETNRYLLKPVSGIEFQKLTLNKTRLENIRTWISQFDSFS